MRDTTNESATDGNGSNDGNSDAKYRRSLAPTGKRVGGICEVPEVDVAAETGSGLFCEVNVKPDDGSNG